MSEFFPFFYIKWVLKIFQIHGLLSNLIFEKDITIDQNIFQIHRQTFLSRVSYTGDMGISFYPRTFLPPVAALSDSINTHYEAGI